MVHERIDDDQRRQRKKNKCFRFNLFFASTKWTGAINVCAGKTQKESLSQHASFMLSSGMWNLYSSSSAPSVGISGVKLCACRILKIIFASYAFVPAFYCWRISRHTQTQCKLPICECTVPLCRRRPVSETDAYICFVRSSRIYAAKCSGKGMRPVELERGMSGACDL